MIFALFKTGSPLFSAYGQTGKIGALNKRTLPAEYDDVPVKPIAILYSIGLTSRRQTVSEKEKKSLTILQEGKTRLEQGQEVITKQEEHTKTVRAGNKLVLRHGDKFGMNGE
ncbi:hypothetical protein [Xenorhabdus griffiniae]|uniref:hypothetical protein n=1 Tax=Xenorhabdus griffiniae TaxID=351672 RepID=UPI002358A794|nr:hypothetical protein [Xenorhabdus griffiniae]MDC9606234.1 hypothetical protein [Xenorhabdus griffiniae]